MNKQKIIYFLSIFLLTIFSLGCMQDMPDVRVKLNYYDNVSNQWKVLDSEVNQKKFIYNQQFKYSVPLKDEYTFTNEVSEGKTLDNREIRVRKTYSFDGSTWSLSSTLGKQEKFDDETFKDASTNLYAYYDAKEELVDEIKYSWCLVDGASLYETTSANGTYTSLNVNKDMTKYNGVSIMDSDFYETTKNADGEATAIRPKIAGDTKRVTVSGTLTRHGYKLLGWTTKYSSDTKILATVPEYPASTSFDLMYKDGYLETPTTVTLYAVWTKDTESGWWSATDFSNNGKFSPVLFRRGENEQSSVYADYPYYKEIKIPAKDYKFYAPQKITGAEKMKSNFAIGEFPITGDLLNQLHEWNEASSKKIYGFEKYELPKPLKDGSTENNSVAYGVSSTWDSGTKKYNYTLKTTNDDGENRWLPVTNLTVPQAIVICNAMTEYYNTNNQSTDRLNYAYTVDGTINGTRIRTIAEARALTASSPNGIRMKGFGAVDDERANGFRIPTDNEWLFAASAIPNNNWVSSQSNYAYPQFQEVGSNAKPSGSQKDNDNPRYAYYKGKDSDIGFKKENNISIRDLEANAAGVKSMSGNINEWVDVLEVYGDDKYPSAYGGNYNGAESDARQRVGEVSLEVGKSRTESKYYEGSITVGITTNAVTNEIDWYPEGEDINNLKEKIKTIGLRMVRTLPDSNNN